MPDVEIPVEQFLPLTKSRVWPQPEAVGVGWGAGKVEDAEEVKEP